MAFIKINTKGFKEIILTRYYNSLSDFNQFNDDVGFNVGQNDFSDYCFDSHCNSWQNDKIKIIKLPAFGQLFYLTNPGNNSPIYAIVTLGQLFLVRDLIDHNILRFSAEGFSNNQFSGNYIAELGIERYCTNQSSNLSVNVKLNMIDLKISLLNSYTLDIIQKCDAIGNGRTNYDVHCMGNLDFSFAQKLNVSFGFVKMIINGGTSELGLSKFNGGSLVLNEILAVDDVLSATLDAAGINDPAAYPYGYPSQPVPAIYKFGYSINGYSNWKEFNLILKHA